MPEIINVVLALVRNSTGQLLIAKRNDDFVPDAHGKWEWVGGKIEYGEMPEAALIREVKEETGLEIKNLRLLPKVFSQFWKNKHGEEFQVILLAYECHTDTALEKIESLDPKISELKFIDPKDIDQYNFLPLDSEIAELLIS